MALASNVLPAYPTAPQISGVPVLAQSPVATVATAFVSEIDSYIQSLLSQWQVLDSSSGNALSMAGILGVEKSVDYNVSNAPQENGAFTSYNKVVMPWTIRVQAICDGSLGTVASFIAALDAIVADLNLYSIVTPDVTYPSMNATHYDMRRTSSSGVTMVVAEVWFEQIRVTGTQAYTQTQTPAGQPTTNVGAVQTSPGDIQVGSLY